MTTPAPDPELSGYVYTGHLVRWIDGDTCDMVLSKTVESTFDFGFRFTHTVTETFSFEARFRMWGINTPERGKPGYAEANAYVAQAAPAGTQGLVVRTYKPVEKYGRWLADVQIPGHPQTINGELISAHLAVPYFGGTKQ